MSIKKISKSQPNLFKFTDENYSKAENEIKKLLENAIIY